LQAHDSYMNNAHNTNELEAYKMTYEVARTTWELASTKAVTTGNPEHLMEARAAMHWMQVARVNLTTAQAGQ